MPASLGSGARALALGIAVSLWLTSAAGVTAATKYKACSLLTAAELEAVLKQKISKTDEGDITIPDGPYKGEVMFSVGIAASGIQVSMEQAKSLADKAASRIR